MIEKKRLILRTSMLALIAVLVSGPVACTKEEPIPAHVLQKQQKKKIDEERQKKKEAAVKKKKEQLKKQQKDDIEASWPAPVRKAAYALATARMHQTPPAARALAMLGLPAVPAMLSIATMGRQPAKKKAFISFLVTEMHMFRLDRLIAFLEDKERPYVQRAAVEALARIGNERATETLKKMMVALAKGRAEDPPGSAPRKEEPAGHDHDHGHGSSAAEPSEEKGYAFSPLMVFVKKALDRPGAWTYNDDQLLTLDRIQHAPTPEELKVALQWVKDLSLEDGMMTLVQSPSTRPAVARATASKLMALAQKKAGKLQDYVTPGYPDPIRILAVRELMKRKKVKDIKYLEKIFSNKNDPLFPLVSQMLRRPPQPAK